VTVVPARKTVYITDPEPDLFRERRQKLMSMLQDSLIERAMIEECVTVGNERKIVLRVPPAVQKRSNVQRVTLHIDSKQQYIRRYVVEYVPGRTVTGMEITFNSFEPNAADRGSASVTTLVLTGRNVLQSKYRGYRLVDLRKRSARN
jgi:hypothetical protein